MPVVWKIDVKEVLRAHGYSTYQLQRSGLINADTCKRLSHGEMVSMYTIEKICALLKCQPGELLFYQFAEEDLPH